MSIFPRIANSSPTRSAGKPKEPLIDKACRSVIDKEATVLQLAVTDPSSAPLGRIALLACGESCMTYRLRKNQSGPVYLVKEVGKCLQ